MNHNAIKKPALILLQYPVFATFKRLKYRAYNVQRLKCYVLLLKNLFAIYESF